MGAEKGEQPPASGSVSVTEGVLNTTPPNSYEPNVPTWRLVALTISICVGLFLSLLDTTIVATAIYTIGVDLKSLDSVNWVALAYTLSYLSCAVIFTRIADIIGRKNAYIAAFVIFFAFSLGCGFARTLNQLIAFRVLQGIGGSGMYSLSFVILTEICTIQQLQKLGAVPGAVVAVVGVLGPILGGVITRYTTWRWIFWINAPIGIIPLIVFIIAWPKPKHMNHAPRRPWKELDLISTFLLIAAAVLVIFPFQQAGMNSSTSPFTSALFIAPLIVGIICWILLMGWETLVHKKWEGKIATMFPIRLLINRVYFGHFLSTLLMGFPYFTVLYALPTRLQVVNGKSQLIAGLCLLPMLFSVACGSAIAGTINAIKDRIFPTLLAGSCFMLVGFATMSTLDDTNGIEAKMYGFEVFIGLGFGLMVATVSLAAALECENRDRTVAQGIIAQARVLGGSLGIAASSSILGSIQRHQLGGIIPSTSLATLQASASSFTPLQLAALKKAYSDAFKLDMKVCAGVTGLTILATMVCFRWKPRDVRERMVEKMKEGVAERIRLARENEAKEANNGESGESV